MGSSIALSKCALFMPSHQSTECAFRFSMSASTHGSTRHLTRSPAVYRPTTSHSMSLPPVPIVRASAMASSPRFSCDAAWGLPSLAEGANRVPRTRLPRSSPQLSICSPRTPTSSSARVARYSNDWSAAVTSRKTICTPCLCFGHASRRRSGSSLLVSPRHRGWGPTVADAIAASINARRPLHTETIARLP